MSLILLSPVPSGAKLYFVFHQYFPVLQKVTVNNNNDMQF